MEKLPVEPIMLAARRYFSTSFLSFPPVYEVSLKLTEKWLLNTTIYEKVVNNYHTNSGILHGRNA